MTTPLLTTKLYIPRTRAEWVPRPRLAARLNSGLNRKITLISAPAGFGKTTLLADWVHKLQLRPSSPLRVAWLSLDRGDNDPARFWAYFVAALQRAQADLGQAAWEMLQASQPRPPLTDGFLTVLVNDIADMTEPLVLVLDDIHLITTEEIHDGLAFFFMHLPPQAHLVLSGRADPPWPLARLRGRGEMAELRANDLRFTTEETAAFLNEAMQLSLTAEEMAALATRTEGWIAGLQMAALSVQGRKRASGGRSVSSFIQAFAASNRFILDFLGEEVLDQQPPLIRQFLLRTSVLDRLTGPLCDSLMDSVDPEGPRTDSYAILTQLERANLFLIPLDDERRWYRYYHLFADVLRRRLSHTEPSLLPSLHLKASSWYEENGLLADAVAHALSADDLDRVVRLVERNALAMLDAGRLTTLESWLKSLPEDLVRSQPWISVSRAWALAYAGEWARVKPLLVGAEQELAERSDSDAQGGHAAEERRIAGHIAAIRSYGTFIEGDFAGATNLAHEALDHLADEDLRPRRFMKALAAAVHRLQGDLAAAEEASVEAVTISRVEGDLHVRVMVLGDLGALQIARGQLRRADQTFRDALQLADEYAGRGGRRLPAMGYIYTHMSRLEREWNDLQAAEHHAREGTELCEQWGLAEILAGSHLYMAAVLQATGEADGALRAMQQAKKVAAELSPWYADRAAAFEAQLHLALGDLDSAAAWLEGSTLIPADDIPFFRESEYRIAAQVLLAQDRLDEALALLLQLLQLAEGAGSIYALIEVMLLRVVALDRQGQTEAAQSELERALSLAEPDGFVRVFVDQGSALAGPLEAAAANGIAPAYVSRLLAALQQESSADDRRPAAVAQPAVHAPSPLVEPLSERELEILRLLTTHLSSTELAEQLFVSVHTIRSHIKSIYGKLNVHRRIEAVERAKELGLL